MKTSFQPGLKFGENQVNGRVSGLHCTWLLPRTRASSDDVDGFLTLRVDPLEAGRSTWRAWPNQYLRGHRIMLCKAALMCLDSLKLSSCARNPHINSGRSEIQ
ncbi:hypothetical protein M9H77_18121 [Catharanthus roseus]|uniref:Uncharacterized protein n=1 Tax=Catharanthus roseus TaxID=4058 RepID=A0ACC0B6K0_CATRO|nr:hypothetical protein M9H77_18121 [Catharanthus roseus]